MEKERELGSELELAAWRKLSEASEVESSLPRCTDVPGKKVESTVTTVRI